jgi:hypothetical protein
LFPEVFGVEAGGWRGKSFLTEVREASASLGRSESEGPKYCARYKFMYVLSMILEIES